MVVNPIQWADVSIFSGIRANERGRYSDTVLAKEFDKTIRWLEHKYTGRAEENPVLGVGL